MKNPHFTVESRNIDWLTHFIFLLIFLWRVCRNKSNRFFFSPHNELKELVGSNANSRNWKGIAISLLVIFIVLSLIVLAVIVKRPSKNLNLDQRPFSLDDVLNTNFEAKRFNGIWLNGMQILTKSVHRPILPKKINLWLENLEQFFREFFH